MTEVLHFAWMDDAKVQRVMAALGAPVTDVRFVGGCVRDALVGRPIHDIDIATPDLPEVVMERLERAGLKAIPTGLAHGTVTAVVAGRAFEITTLRRDTSCDGRHAAVAFTTDWREDASRRDFTLNAMSLSPGGKLFDDFGGREDALAGRIVFVGQPADRIKEDYLRVLRLFRFHAHFGRVPIDAETLKACAQHTAGLSALSGERVRQELMKLLIAPDPVASLQAMIMCDVLACILPESQNTQTLSAMIELEAASHLPPQAVRRLGAMLAPAADIHGLCERLRLTNQESDALAAMLAPLPAIAAWMQVSDYDLLLYRHGPQMILDRTLLVAAREGHGARWQPLIMRAMAWVHRPMPLSGADILKLGVAPGPSVGNALRAAEALWSASGFAASPDELLVRAKATLSESGK